MDKYFICLANSYKHGGRCVAGIELTFDANGKPFIMRHPDGRPRWIRPISDEVDGAIPNEIAQNIKLFSVIKLIEAIPCPNKAHVEDTKYSQMECRHGYFTKNDELLKLCLDNKHQNIFYFQGKAISSVMVERLNYSLMLIKPDKVQAYIDEEREKSKYRMRFSYYGLSYDLPITDPLFLEVFKTKPECYSDLKDVYLTLSLGLEFEGFHYKLVAAVIQTDEPVAGNNVTVDQNKGLTYMELQKRQYTNAYAKWTPEEDALLMEMYNSGCSVRDLMKKFERNEGSIRSRLKKLKCEQDDLDSWFGEYEKELAYLINQKKLVENQIASLRAKLINELESRDLDIIDSNLFTVVYTPVRTVMLFDGRAFRLEHEDLYAQYCKPHQKEASIVVRRKKQNE